MFKLNYVYTVITISNKYFPTVASKSFTKFFEEIKFKKAKASALLTQWSRQKCEHKMSRNLWPFLLSLSV